MDKPIAKENLEREFLAHAEAETGTLCHFCGKGLYCDFEIAETDELEITEEKGEAQ